MDIDKTLLTYLPKGDGVSSKLLEAMRYSLMSGGKRIRPILVLAACEAVGGQERQVMPAACAIEMIHTYSLIHDDLPCMDDDDLRRGKPTCHKKFGEAVAVLAGDALLTRAFEILAKPLNAKDISMMQRQMTAMGWIAEAAGAHGMVGGQALDMAWQGKKTSLALQEKINLHKTGHLIAVSLRAGSYLGGGSSAQVGALWRYGQELGLLFQIVDDILDKDGYAKLLGLDEASQKAANTCLRAQKELKIFGKKAQTLLMLAQTILERKK